jgi:hypothetical protein
MCSSSCKQPTCCGCKLPSCLEKTQALVSSVWRTIMLAKVNVAAVRCMLQGHQA